MVALSGSRKLFAGCTSPNSRNVARRAKAPEPRYSLSPVQAELPPPSDPGRKLSGWFKSPFDLVAFGPRLAVGALMSAPERLQTLSAEVQRVNELLSSPAPVEDKSKMLAFELEIIATECLEKGAVVEADVIQQMKTLLPPDIADKIRTPENPATPQRSEVGPISTSTSPVVTELPKDLDLD